MHFSIDYEMTRRIFKVQVQLSPDQIQAIKQQNTTISNEAQRERQRSSNQAMKLTDEGTKKKLGRNDPCWCGSGKKWKKCHYPQNG